MRLGLEVRAGRNSVSLFGQLHRILSQDGFHSSNHEELRIGEVQITPPWI